jgi:hypothetical protein
LPAASSTATAIVTGFSESARPRRRIGMISERIGVRPVTLDEA